MKDFFNFDGFPGRIQVTAVHAGERLDLRHCRARITSNPTVVKLPSFGLAVLFRHGSIVLINVAEESHAATLGELKNYIVEAHPFPEKEEAEIVVAAEQREGMSNDTIIINELTIARIQIVAVILAKSVVLAQYEESIAKVFERIEPLAVQLKQTGRSGRRAEDLLKDLGQALLMQHKMVARVEIPEKPDLLWENPGLERLYARLEEEYELKERHLALGRKLNLITETATTALELLRSRRSLRVEWYIVLLIMLDIVIALYEIFFHTRV